MPAEIKLENPPILGETPGLVQGSKWLRKLKIWLEDSNSFLSTLPGLDRFYRSELLKRVLKAGDTMTGDLTMSGSDVIVSGLDGDIITTDKLGESIEELDSYTKDLNDQFQNDRKITGDPTGFYDDVNCVVSYNPTTRKITLSGTVEAYYKGDRITTLTNGWVSDAHDATDGTWFLKYNGSGFTWSQTSWSFDEMQIAIVYYSTSDKFGIRECHGFMPQDCHRSDHYTIGTWRQSGGDLSGYTPASTTEANRRPLVSDCTIWDEDLQTIVTAIASASYTQFYLSSTGTVNFIKSQGDIVPLSTNQPYWNQYTGGAWQQTLMSNNTYMSIWLIALPAAADSDSQHYRFLWVQGQTNGSLASETAKQPNEINLGNLTAATPELVFIAKVIIQYTAANWSITSVTNLTGTRFSQVGSPSGTYLSSVSTDTTLSGSGTASSPLSVIGITQSSVPASSTATGIKGAVSWDNTYLYICTATDTWKRISWGTALTLEPDTW